MGDSVGFTTQPLSFSATIGTLAAAGTAIGAAGLLIGGGIWFHRIRKAEEAAEQAEAAAQRLLNERLTPGHANFDAVFANECIANNVILDLDVSSPAYSKQKLLTFLTTVGALTDANKAKLLGELAAAHADATRAVKLTAQEIAAFDAHFKAAKVAVPVV
jgi:hypothetical protein